ncbi:MAG: DUF559 domain-containing protein [Dehalococcoidia bacterium]|nr:DUF559 domain-containing protein [Dehalococcoidia bacterium]
MSERDPVTASIARKLRRDQTDAERMLWSKLRAGQLGCAKFRRQFPLPPYVADFCCEAARLIVEVDGGQHAESVEADQERTAFFEQEGYSVLRSWNNDVLTNIDGVAEVILKRLGAPTE